MILLDCGSDVWVIQMTESYLLMNFGLLMNKSYVSLNKSSLKCASCKMGKSKELAFPTYSAITTECFDLIHSDVWGIAPSVSHSQHKYFMTFIDDLRSCPYTPQQNGVAKRKNKHLLDVTRTLLL